MTALTLALALAACPAPAPAPSGGTDELTLATLEKLRDEIMKDVEELRGLEFEKPVAVEIASSEQFLAYAQQRTEEVLDETARDAESWMARMLDLVPADMDVHEAMLEFAEDQVGGFYDPASDTFFVAASYSDSGLLRIILAHELTHALDDQHFDIDGVLYPRARVNSDSASAYMAVVEGSGTSIMNRWAMPRALKGEISLEDLQDADTAAGLAKAPQYLWKPMLHSYMHGAAFLARTNNVMRGQTATADLADLETAFEDPPRSTEQILHPEKYWDEDERDEPREVAVSLREGSDWSLLREDTSGELGLAILTTPRSERKAPDGPMGFLQVRYTNDAAAGWGGDRWALLGRGDARVFVSASVWDTVEDAVEFADALETIRPSVESRVEELGEGTGAVEIRRSDDRVLFGVASGASSEELARLLGQVGVVVN